MGWSSTYATRRRESDQGILFPTIVPSLGRKKTALFPRQGGGGFLWIPMIEEFSQMARKCLQIHPRIIKKKRLWLEPWNTHVKWFMKNGIHKMVYEKKHIIQYEIISNVDKKPPLCLFFEADFNAFMHRSLGSLEPKWPFSLVGKDLVLENWPSNCGFKMYKKCLYIYICIYRKTPQASSQVYQLAGCFFKIATLITKLFLTGCLEVPPFCYT